METVKITSVQNEIVKHLVKLRMEAAYRKEKQLALMEGKALIEESSKKPKRLFFTEECADFVETFEAEKIEVSSSVFKKISGIHEEKGVVGEYFLPGYSKLCGESKLLVFDAVSDPGNLGTLMRTALAFGWKHFFFLPGSADPFNDKVIRAARGAPFKSKLFQGTAKELKEWKEANGFTAFSADLKGASAESLSKNEVDLLILGNEGHGISAEIKNISTPVTIPMSGEMESLNVAVAGAILLYLFSPGAS